ncbi:MAG: MBOAT family protein [Lachnospiraceae bacterium]
MVFSSTVFLFIFLPLVLVGYYLLDKKFRNIFLLLTSLFFYGWGEPKFVFIMVGSIFMNYLFALGIDKFRKKKYIANSLLTGMVLANITIFFIFKYLGFAVENINYIFGKELVLPQIALPIGISFFTFQAISYVIDVYRGKGEVQKNPLNVGLYISFFPQLIAGPIVRYETVAKEIKQRKETWTDFTNGLERFIVGLGKKVLLSNALAIIADRCFSNIASPDISVLMAWIGAISYTLQIFFDFSGYSDMAIGLGRMFGFHFVENFNYPYISKSISDFWRRWHISLSTWFRDYVYIPLGGSRVKQGRLILNLVIVWTLTGVWHGASWNFIWWGWFYLIILIFEKLTGVPECFKTKAGKILYQIFTLLSVNFAWVLFRAENIDIAILYVKKMLGMCGNNIADARAWYILFDNKWIFLAAILFSTPIMLKIKDRIKSEWGKIVCESVKSLSLLIILGVCICSIVSSSYNPFIYFNF